MHSIKISNFGPIDYFEMNLSKKLNVFIGQQATGKSTIVKLIYFGESVKDELYNFLLDEQQLADKDTTQLLRGFSGVLVQKFKSFFGSTKHYKDYKIKFSFGQNKEMTIGCDKINNKYGWINFNGELKNLVHNIIVSSKNYYKNIDVNDVLIAMNKDELYKRQITSELNRIFENDYYISLFIPAGRYWTTTNPSLDSYEKVDYLLQKFTNYVNIVKRSFQAKLEEIALNDNNSYKQSASYKDTVELLAGIIRRILKGDYFYNNFEEKIVYGKQPNEYVYLSQASSGQQEVLWILLIIFDVIVRNRKMIIIIEEPEAHIFPEAQKQIMELIALLINHTGSKVFVTTHSPYTLTSLNLLIHSANVESKIKSKNSIVHEKLRIESSNVSAYYFSKNETFNAEDIIDKETGTIKAENIDKVSDIIYDQTDKLLNLEVRGQ